MIAKVCNRESRRDSWFENRLVKQISGFFTKPKNSGFFFFFDSLKKKKKRKKIIIFLFFFLKSEKKNPKGIFRNQGVDRVCAWLAANRPR